MYGKAVERFYDSVFGANAKYFRAYCLVNKWGPQKQFTWIFSLFFFLKCVIGRRVMVGHQRGSKFIRERDVNINNIEVTDVLYSVYFTRIYLDVNWEAYC